MTALTIKDLSASTELDTEAMASVSGGHSRYLPVFGGPVYKERTRTQPQAYQPESPFLPEPEYERESQGSHSPLTAPTSMLSTALLTSSSVRNRT